jgi:hypothetical protein
MATDMHVRIQQLLEAVFSLQHDLRLYNKDQWDKPKLPL